MKQFMGFPGQSPADLLDMLQSNAFDTDEEAFVQKFMPEEMAKTKDEHLDNLKKWKKLNNKLTKVKKDLTGQMKPLKENADQLLTNIEQGGEMVKEEVFYFLDTQEKKMGTYDRRGVLISERFATEVELRTTANIFQMAPAAEERFVNPDTRIESSASQATGTSDVEPNEAFKFKADDEDKPF